MVTVPMVGAPSGSWPLARSATTKRQSAAQAASRSAASPRHGALDRLVHVRLDAMCPRGTMVANGC